MILTIIIETLNYKHILKDLLNSLKIINLNTAQ